MIKLSLNEKQMFLDGHIKNRIKNTDSIRFLNWNIRNPSLQRAVKQTEWLNKNNFDVIVLTEVKLSEGCLYIRDRLSSLGYTTIITEPREDYGVILAIKDHLKEISRVSVNYLSHRVSCAVCDFLGNNVLITGVYMPVWRDEKKKRFLDAFEELLKNENLKFDSWIILGDMNLLEPDHFPQYSEYKDWEYFYNVFGKYGFVDAFRHFHPKEREYSWFGRKGNGYRFDHIFVSKNLLPLIKDCFYIHEPRIKKLSDHSAMCFEIEKVGRA